MYNILHPFLVLKLFVFILFFKCPSPLRLARLIYIVCGGTGKSPIPAATLSWGTRKEHERQLARERNKKTVGKRRRLQDTRRQGRASAGRTTTRRATNRILLLLRHLPGTSYISAPVSLTLHKPYRAYYYNLLSLYYYWYIVYERAQTLSTIEFVRGGEGDK